MSDRHRDRLVEETLTAWRPRDPDGRILPHPAWADLLEVDRRRAFDESLLARRLESWLDRRGLTATSRAVLERIREFQGK